jgi:hypothetical protein
VRQKYAPNRANTKLSDTRQRILSPFRGAEPHTRELVIRTGLKAKKFRMD